MGFHSDGINVPESFPSQEPGHLTHGLFSRHQQEAIMAVYVIGYDLHPTKGETYGELIEAIKQIGSTWWHCLDSTWIVITDLSAVQVRDQLWQHMKADDQLLVMTFTKGTVAAWNGFAKGNCAEWLTNNL
jgi:hypothetical protein